jgi:hypothetical protein
MEYKNTLNKIKTLLSIEVKLEQMKLVDGVTVVEAEQFAPEYSIGVVTADGIVPMPVGSYELENGQMVTVEQEGVIYEIKDAQAEETEAAPAEVVEPEMEAAPAPKRVVESVSKETFFEEIEKLRAELSLIKAEKEALELSIQEEAAAEAINTNPEAQKVEMFRYANNRAKSTKDTVYSKLFN